MVKSTKYTLFSFHDGVTSAARKVYRKLYGYNLYGKHYKGLLEKHKGKKLGSGAIIIPSLHAKEVKSLFLKTKMKFKSFEVSSIKQIK